MSRNLDAVRKDLIHILSESQDYVLTLKDICEIDNSTLDRHIANCFKMMELLQKVFSEESGPIAGRTAGNDLKIRFRRSCKRLYCRNDRSVCHESIYGYFCSKSMEVGEKTSCFSLFLKKK